MHPIEVLEERLSDEEQKHITGGEVVTSNHPVCPLLAADQAFLFEEGVDFGFLK